MREEAIGGFQSPMDERQPIKRLQRYNGPLKYFAGPAKGGGK